MRKPVHHPDHNLRWWVQLSHLFRPMTEAATRQRANVIDTNAEVLLREVELRGRLAELQQKKTPQELAAEKLPMVSVAAVTFIALLKSCLAPSDKPDTSGE